MLKMNTHNVLQQENTQSKDWQHSSEITPLHQTSAKVNVFCVLQHVCLLYQLWQKTKPHVGGPAIKRANHWILSSPLSASCLLMGN